MLKINLNLSSYKWTPYQIRLYIKENWVFIFEREFCPVFFYTIVDISWTTRLRHYKLQRLWITHRGGKWWWWMSTLKKITKQKEEEDPSPWMWATWFSPHYDTMTWHHSLLWRDYLIRYIASSLFALSHFHDINLTAFFIGIWFANNQDSRIRQLLII